MRASLFFQSWLASLLLLLFLVAGGNYLVDPYGLFNTPRVSGINERKPVAGTRVRVVKPYQVLQAQPRALIVGNSRPEMGLDPSHACWSSKPVYNLAVPGAGAYMQARFAQHALVATQPNLILWGVDFVDFLVGPEEDGDPFMLPPLDEAFEQRLLTSPQQRTYRVYQWRFLKDHLSSLLSMDALTGSVRTVWGQGNMNSSNRTRLGFNPAREYLDIIQSEGQGVLFQQKRKQIVATLTRKKWGIYHAGTRWSREFEALKNAIIRGREQGVRVVIFINPYHAEYLQSIRLTGKWILFENWKREIVRIASEQGIGSVWDFSGFDRYSSESLPVEGKHATAMKWFWEPAHYRKELGDLMLGRMLEEDCPGGGEVADYGFAVSPMNIDLHLEQGRLAAAEYESVHVEVVSRLKKLVEEQRWSNP